MEVTFTASVWVYDGPGGWHFVTVPAGISARIHALARGAAKPFGSVAVTALIGHTRWATSIFWDRARGAYLLPVKALVRKKEQLREADTVEVTLLAALDEISAGPG